MIVWFAFYKNYSLSAQIDQANSQIGPNPSLARTIWASACRTALYLFWELDLKERIDSTATH